MNEIAKNQPTAKEITQPKSSFKGYSLEARLRSPAAYQICKRIILCRQMLRPQQDCRVNSEPLQESS